MTLGSLHELFLAQNLHLSGDQSSVRPARPLFVMTNPNRPKEVKTLDGTIGTLNDASDLPVIPSKGAEFLLRSNVNRDPRANSSQPLSGNALTGKQEHCKATATSIFETMLRVQT